MKLEKISPNFQQMEIFTLPEFIEFIVKRRLFLYSEML